MENFDIIDFNKEAKKVRKKEERKERLEKMLMWMQDNPGLAAFLLSTASGILVFSVKSGISITKSAIRSRNLKKEEALKNLYCYDRSLGHYWSLRRELSNSEWLAIDERKKNGERLADILNDLKVLK